MNKRNVSFILDAAVVALAIVDRHFVDVVRPFHSGVCDHIQQNTRRTACCTEMHALVGRETFFSTRPKRLKRSFARACFVDIANVPAAG